MSKEILGEMRGRVYSFTTVYEDAIPEGFGDIPYVLAIIESEEGVRLTSQLTDLKWDERKVIRVVSVGGGEYVEVPVIERIPRVKIDDEVEMVTRRLGDTVDERGLLVYGYKFRPAMD